MANAPRKRSRRHRIERSEPLEPRLVMTSLTTLASSCVMPLQLDNHADDLHLAGVDEAGNSTGVGHPAQLSPWGSPKTLREIHEVTGVALAHHEYDLRGTGQTVAIIDSGIAWDHESLGSGLGTSFRVVGGWDFTEENDADPYDDGPAGFHGTHVAGIVGSSDTAHTGVAPQVDFVGLRVFNDQGRSRMSWIEASLDWVIENADAFEHPITTVNMSIGTDWNDMTLPEYADLEDELNTLHQMGIFVSVAAGNSFDPAHEGLSYPAASPFVTPVASHGIDASRQISPFSQRSGRTLVAPGESVTSTVPDYLEDFNGRADDYYAASGTSMASPYVAGASVLVREAMWRMGIEPTVDAIEQVLFDTADVVVLPDAEHPLHFLNVGKAVESILGGASLSVEHIGDELVVWGTDGDDHIVFDSHGQLVINGKEFDFDPAAIERVTISGQGGEDRLVVHEHADQARVQLMPGSARIRSGSLELNATGFQRTEVFLTGERTATQLVGDDGIDEIFLKPTHSWMESDGRVSYVRGSGVVTAWASDSADEVTLYGSEHDDLLHATPVSTRLTGHEFDLHAIGFAQVVVLAQQGGHDVGSIAGSEKDDFVRARGQGVSLAGPRYFLYVRDFASLSIDGSGGDDLAILYGSDGDDKVVLGVGRHSIRSPQATTSLLGFSRVEAYASGGNDAVRIEGSKRDEQFTAKPTHSWMEFAGGLNYARGFEHVMLFSGGGKDSALVYDSSGDDQFRMASDLTQAIGAGFQIDVHAMSRVHAVSTGGADIVRFMGSEQIDRLYAQRVGVWMKGYDYTVVAESFAHVLASSDDVRDRLIIDPALTVVPLLANEDQWHIEDDDLDIVARGFRR